MWAFVSGCAGSGDNQPAENLLIIGASGRVGGPIADEAIDRGYKDAGMTRDSARLTGRSMDIVVGAVLDREMLAGLLSRFDVVVVSVGGPPTSRDPGQNIAVPAKCYGVRISSC